MISDKLEKLVEEMVDKGVQFEDAVHEFEKRFIARVLGSCEGSLTKTADTLGIHRNTLTRKMGEYRIKRERVGGDRVSAPSPSHPVAAPLTLPIDTASLTYN